MMTRRAWFGLATAAIVGVVCIGQAFGQDNPAPPPGGPGGGRFDPAAMRKMMEDRMKTNLGVTDDEWKVLQPKIEAVQTLRMESMMGGMRGMFGRGPRPGQPAPGGDRPAGEAAPATPPQSDTAKASDALSKVLENKEAKPEDIKSALQALRDAKAATKAKLEKAQKDLKEIVTVKQEAQLVMMGTLD
jgi:hypothetical protein